MRIGIIGAGNIAVHMADTVNGMAQRGEDVQLYAVASRSAEKAEAFAQAYHCEKAYGSYEAMVRDPAVDIVYVATPHSHHFEHVKLAVEHGKHVLCEKAFTVNAKQAEDIFALARAHHVVVTEAIWTRYMPARGIINALLEQEVIGKVHALTANLHYNIAHVERLVRPQLAGGALLDVGIYPLNFALMHFGSDFERIESSVIKTDTGVDGQETMTLFWSDGRMASLTAGIYTLSDRQGIFYGTKGYMIVDNINNPLHIDIYDADRKKIRTVDMPEQITGYEYQVRELMQTIRNGQTECPSMPHAETVRVMRIMDGLRREWGIRYPME